MKSRQEIKANAKAAMKQQWGLSIAILLIFFVVVFAGGLLGAIPVIGLVIVYATLFFIDMPLMIHMQGIFIKTFKNEKAEVGELFSGFSVNWLRKVGGMAWMMLWVSLWSLLFFVPGIVKGLAYSMAPYILADCPNVKARDALKISMRMTNGHKMNLFVMSLSFIGWFLLGGLTLGILTIVFVMPYMYTTYAGYYLELRDQAIASGAVTADELA